MGHLSRGLRHGATQARRARHDDVRCDESEEHRHREAEPLARQRVCEEDAASKVRQHRVDDDDAIALWWACHRQKPCTA